MKEQSNIVSNFPTESKASTVENYKHLLKSSLLQHYQVLLSFDVAFLKDLGPLIFHCATGAAWLPCFENTESHSWRSRVTALYLPYSWRVRPINYSAVIIIYVLSSVEVKRESK